MRIGFRHILFLSLPQNRMLCKDCSYGQPGTCRFRISCSGGCAALRTRGYHYTQTPLIRQEGTGEFLCYTFFGADGILTGGLANSRKLTGMVIDYLHNLCRVVVLPGENEMEALALGALRLLRGEEEVRRFYPVCPVVQGR